MMFVHIFLPSWYLSTTARFGHRFLESCTTNLTYLSYADDVLKEITKPRTVPRTVNSVLETNNFTSVYLLTRTTTVAIQVIRRTTKT